MVALLAMVIATFSTGIDSQCFQVHSKIEWVFFSPFLWRFPKLKSLDKRLLQFRKKDICAEDDVPYGYGFFHFVFATGAMYFSMLLIGWNTHYPMKKYALL